MKRPPNILIFMTDHQRGDTVLPEHPVVKPNLDRFVRQSLAFTETFCPSPHCCPSRATFATGLYPSRHGVWNNIVNDQALSRKLNDGVKVWSEDLAAAGYRLAWAGKWHVSTATSPKDHGWEELVHTGSKAEFHGQRWGKYREEAQKPEDTRREWGQILRPGYGTYTMFGAREQGNRHDEEAVAASVAALPKLAASGSPWALYVGCQGPHDPYLVPQRFVDLYDLDKVRLPPSFADTLEDKPRIYRRMRRMLWGQLSEREIRDAIRHFWAYCTYLDDLFGKVLSALEATGQADETLVLYTSDHGDYCGEHGLFAKGIPCFRGAYHVPAVVRWPKGLAQPGGRSDAFVSLADFGPTFHELAGLRPDPDLTGRSLVPFLRGQTPADWRDEMHTQCDGVELYFTQRSVRTRAHKYVFNGFDDDELYDLARDPHEMRNLAGDPAYDGVKKELCRRLWRFAYREKDRNPSGYITVGLVPYGPGEGFRGD